MKKKMLLTLSLLFLISQTTFAITAEEIIDESKKLPTPDTAMMRMKMKIYKGGKVQEKEFEILTKKYPEDEDKALVEFIKPTRIKLLTHTHKGKEDNQWLMLSSGKVKRIASSDRGKSFVNSHFCYEDLSSQDRDNYTYTLLGEEAVNGKMCYKIETIQKARSDVYDKTIIYIRKTDYFALKVDFIKDGRLYKFLENYDIEDLDGIKTPHKIVMAMADGNEKTELLAKEIKYNFDIMDQVFNKEALR